MNRPPETLFGVTIRGSWKKRNFKLSTDLSGLLKINFRFFIFVAKYIAAFRQGELSVNTYAVKWRTNSVFKRLNSLIKNFYTKQLKASSEILFNRLRHISPMLTPNHLTSHNKGYQDECFLLPYPSISYPPISCRSHGSPIPLLLFLSGIRGTVSVIFTCVDRAPNYWGLARLRKVGKSRNGRENV